MTSSETNTAELARQREWLKDLIGYTGWAPTRVASVSGVAQTTLTNLLNDPDHPHLLSNSSISKIVNGTGFPRPGQEGFAEVPPRPFDHEEMGEHGEWNPNHQFWEVRNELLTLAGLLKGDKILCDASVTPKDGDVVIAQIYDVAMGAARTVIRVYRPPYLTTAAVDPTKNKISEADRGAQIMSVMIELRRRPRD
ncbi:MAG: hypothetical protein AB7S41_11280 [Parvibaculaceae bacterium]